MIDWANIPDEFTHAARDGNDKWYVYTEEPLISGKADKWVLDSPHARYLEILCKLDIPWKESLTERLGSNFENIFKL